MSETQVFTGWKAWVAFTALIVAAVIAVPFLLGGALIIGAVVLTAFIIDAVTGAKL
jgi:hypothetical protein